MLQPLQVAQDRRPEPLRSGVPLLQLGIAMRVPPDWIRAYGLGERCPVASNAGAAGRQQNRRVELIVLRRDQRYRLTDLTSPTG